MATLYDAIGGDEAVLALAHAWHERVLADPVVSHAFQHGFRDDHTERLAAYWAEVLGGPTTYSETMGDESHVVRLHTGNGPHDDMDSRAIGCFAEALRDVGVQKVHHGALVDVVPRREPVRQPPLRVARRRAAGLADAGRGRVISHRVTQLAGSPQGKTCILGHSMRKDATSELVPQLRDRGGEQLGHSRP